MDQGRQHSPVEKEAAAASTGRVGRAHPSRAPSMELRWPVDEQIFHLARCVCARPPVEEWSHVLLRAWAQRVTDDLAAQRQDGVEKWAFVPCFGGAPLHSQHKGSPGRAAIGVLHHAQQASALHSLLR